MNGRGTRIALFVHVVFGTHRRRSLIAPSFEGRLHGAVRAKAEQLGCEPIAIGGTTDHLHVLVGLDAAIAVAKLVGEMKGASSHVVNETVKPSPVFRWQSGYAAFSVSADDVAAVQRYVLDQKRHHAARAIEPEFELADL